MEIKILMLKNGITGKELAKKLGMAENSLSVRLNGKRDFTLKEAKQLAKIFNKTIEELFPDY